MLDNILHVGTWYKIKVMNININHKQKVKEWQLKNKDATGAQVLIALKLI